MCTPRFGKGDQVFENIAILVVSLAVLWFISDLLVGSILSLSQRFEIPQSIAGATLAAISSSAPEFGTSVFSTIQAANHPMADFSDIGIGTIIGSAVFNITMITGLSALVHPLKVLPRVFWRDGMFYLVTTLLAIWFVWDSRVETWEALTWVGFYMVYMVVLIRDVKKHPEEAEEVPEMPLGKSIFYFFFSVAVIGVACHFLVESTSAVAKGFDIPTSMISLVVVAVGTSLPDTLASIAATRRGNYSLAISNAVGSNVFDILICLGLPIALHNLISTERNYFQLGGLGDFKELSQGFLVIGLLLLFVTMVFFLIVIRTDWKVTRREGIGLILSYAGFLAIVGLLYAFRQTGWVRDFLKMLG